MYNYFHCIDFFIEYIFWHFGWIAQSCHHHSLNSAERRPLLDIGLPKDRHYDRSMYWPMARPVVVLPSIFFLGSLIDVHEIRV